MVLKYFIFCIFFYNTKYCYKEYKQYKHINDTFFLSSTLSFTLNYLQIYFNTREKSRS